MPALAADLPAGWYRVRLNLTAADRHAVRKRGDLSADLGGDRLALAQFEWNAAAAEDLIVNLPRPARELTLTVIHAGPADRIDRATVARVSPARALARAVRLKLGLLLTYNCFWPVAGRGLRLLAKGRFAEVRRRLFKGLPDSRDMRIEVKQAAEAGAAWWRRQAMAPERVAALRAEAAAAELVPVAILVPVDATRVAHARHAVVSAVRQIYPHWELILVWPAGPVPKKLAAAAAWDGRCRVVVGAAAAVASIRAPRAVVLPADWELAEHALLRVAQSSAAAVSLDPATPNAPVVLPTVVLQESPPPSGSAVALLEWAASLTTGTPAAAAAEPLATPMNAGALAVAAPVLAGRPLVLAANVAGISGWDYLAFCLAVGLRSLGTEVRQHPRARLKPELFPPNAAPRPLARTSADPQLIVTPPFNVASFAPDAATAVFTMWETDRLPAADVAALNRARVVIVPSRWAVECFRASGVTTPLEVVPLGYDPLVFHPTSTPESPRTQSVGTICTFGTAGALSAGGLRKNVARVIDLFRRAFPTEADVRLRVKITPNCPPLHLPDDPRIDVLRATLPHADLAAWNRSLTCYVNASFAEGFGLHLLEAMACGRPLISTAYSGVAEFFDADVGYVVPHTLIEAKNDVYAGRWADPDDAAIVAAMREVYADRAAAADKGRRAAARARRFTWRDAGRRLVVVLKKYDMLGRR